MDINRCLHAFGLQSHDQLIVVKEQHLAESNFVISYLLKQALQDRDEHNQVILVLTHNSIGHYECVAKRLGYNLQQKINEGVIQVIDVQSKIVQCMHDFNIANAIEETLCEYVKNAFLNEHSAGKGRVLVFFDDFTHLHDCLLSVTDSINLLNRLLGHHYNDERIGYIVGLHMGDVNDKIISGDMEYSADCIIDISLMKTGRSDDVSGVMKVIRNRKLATYHYKVKDYGIDMYKPGEILIR